MAIYYGQVGSIPTLEFKVAVESGRTTLFLKGLVMVREISSHRVEGDGEHLHIQALDETGRSYQITSNQVWSILNFQTGDPRKEVNGVTHEALLAIVIDRLQTFQNGPFPSPHNDNAITALKIALSELQARTLERMARKVEGQQKQ